MYFVALAGTALKIYKRNGSGWDVEIASGAITAFIANTDHMIRFRASGTTLSAKIWVPPAPEPSSWDVEVTDSDFATGKPGCFTSPNSTSTTTKFKHFNCNDLTPPSGGIIRSGGCRVMSGSRYNTA
jgi:hypothetical protein